MQVQAAAAEPGAASQVAYDAMAAQSSRLSPNTGVESVEGGEMWCFYIR